VTERWFRAATALYDPSHELSPMQTGEPACRRDAWMDLISQARWKPQGGLQRGQLRTSIRFLAARWNWGKDRVLTFLRDLENSGSVTRQQAGRSGSILTICNYDRYNPPGEHDPPTTPPVYRYANKDASKDANQDKVVQVQVQTEKHIWRNDPAFLRFKDAFPVRAGGHSPKTAYTHWRARIKDGVPVDTLVSQSAAYAAFVEAEGRAGTSYVKAMENWLSPNYAGWEREWVPSQNQDNEIVEGMAPPVGW
jgi:hypothetical protein